MIGKLLTKTIPPLRYIGLIVTTAQGIIYLIILIRHLKRDEQDFKKLPRRPIKK